MSPNSNEVFSIDMHIHTSRYSECAETLHPEKIEEYALKAGLDAVIITEHDTCWKRSDLRELQESSTSIQIFNGVEVTTKSGCHLIVYGIEELGPLRKGIPCEEAIRYVHESDGIIILAHPFRKSLPPLNIIEQFDAIEVGSTSLYKKESDLSMHLAQTLEKPVIGSSDAHALSMIGWAYTRFPSKPVNPKDLCRMIKEGIGEVVMPNPFPC